MKPIVISVPKRGVEKNKMKLKGSPQPPKTEGGKDGPKALID